MPNNVAEVVLRVTTEGAQNAQALAVQLVQLDQIGKQAANSMVVIATAQRACTAEATRSHSQLERLLQDWGDLQRQVDHFSATTLQHFASTSAHALTEWIEGSHNAREAFRGFADSVIEGIIRMMIQQTIAHALGIGQTQAAAAAQSTANAEITATAAPAAAMQGAATFGANSIGVAVVIAAVLAGIAALATTKRAGGGAIYGAGSESSDSIPAWLSHNEYIQPASAHRYYGTDAMDAIRNRSIPREAIRAAMEHRTFSVGGAVSIPVPAFAAGGFNSGAGVPPAISVGSPTVLLALGQHEVDRLMATTEVQKRLFDNQTRNALRISRLAHRQGGHRAES